MDIEAALHPDDNFYVEVTPNVWLMDDHRWAYLIWELHRDDFTSVPAAIVHVDYHWDAGDDFFHYPDKEAEFINLPVAGIEDLVRENKWIRFDSFICPALIRRIADEVHFLCFQENGEEGIYIESLKKNSACQYIYRSVDDLAKVKIEKPLIFDFCIDVFNRSDDKWFQGEIWSSAEVYNFLSALKPLIKSAQLITVSMSYGYSGTEEDTAFLTRKVMGLISEWRS